MTVNLLPCTGNCPVLTFVSRISSMKKKVPYLRIAFKANEKRREKMRFDEDHLPSNNISTYLFDILITMISVNYSRQSKLRSWDIFIKSGFT